MGDDEQRWLWIELKAPGKRNRMETADENGNYWYQVFTANYKGFHYMIIRNRQWRYIDLRSASYIGGERRPDVWQLFGHVHTRNNNTGNDADRLQYLYPTQYDVGVDNNGFAPVSFEQVKRLINKQVEQTRVV